MTQPREISWWGAFRHTQWRGPGLRRRRDSRLGAARSPARGHVCLFRRRQESADGRSGLVLPLSVCCDCGLDDVGVLRGTGGLMWCRLRMRDMYSQLSHI